MTRSDRPPRYHSFLLTAWEERSEEADAPTIWRFSLERIRAEEGRHLFATFEGMMLFLREEIEGSGKR
jgi:hypothetical protein